MTGALGIVAVLLLVLANGFFVAAEFSLVSVRRTRIEQLVEEGNIAAKATKKAIDHLDSYIAATQLGITLASLALGWIGEPAVGGLFEGLLERLPIPHEWQETVGRSLAAGTAFAVVTMLHIVVGELAPKSIALQRPERVSLFVARPTTWFLRIFRPIIFFMNSVGNLVVRLLGFEPVSGHSNVHSPEELEMLVHSSREAGLLQESEERLLRRVFDFSEITVRQVMRPRIEVDAIDIDSPLPEMLATIADSHYSRYPVYKGSKDTIVGILHTKDLLDAIGRQRQFVGGDGSVALDIASILRKPLYVPQTVSVDRLLDQMKRAKMHIAVVIDEYGGMAGVATMEDILEELVGEVEDEFDSHVESIETQDGESLVDGLVSLNEIAERFGELSEVEGKIISTTIGGYVAERLGRIPKVGDTARFGEYELQVAAMDGMRVSQVRFSKCPVEQIEEKPGS